MTHQTEQIKDDVIDKKEEAIEWPNMKSHEMIQPGLKVEDEDLY